MNSICQLLSTSYLLGSSQLQLCDPLRKDFLNYTAKYGHSYKSELEMEFAFRRYKELDEYFKLYNKDPQNSFKLEFNKFSLK